MAQIAKPKDPSKSTLWCPYCGCPLRDDVPLVGQQVVCPDCQAAVTMPDASGTTQRAAKMQFVFALGGFVLAILLLVKGCALMNLAG